MTAFQNELHQEQRLNEAGPHKLVSHLISPIPHAGFERNVSLRYDCSGVWIHNLKHASQIVELDIMRFTVCDPG